MHFVRRLLANVACLLLGGLLAASGLYLYQALSGPPLHPWHTWKSAAEFHAGSDAIHDFPAYLRLETELFEALNTFRHSVEAPRISRYSPHNRWVYPVNGVDWNRTVELESNPASGAVLLLHGMSDSPYSLRSLAREFQRQGFVVLALRLPGHGTVPASLTRFSWQDMAKAVKMAALYLRPFLQQGQPLFLLGYSNGATLALDYTLTALEDDQLPLPSGMILISPAIAVTPAARFSRLIIAAGLLPGLQKLAWLSRQPEYDPYKYNSFAVNAGYQVYLLAASVQKRLRTLQQGSGMEAFPPVLAIQSVVDTTVSSRAVVNQLMSHLSSGKDELILFDVNRDADIVSLFARKDRSALDALMSEPAGFALTLVTNRDPESPQVWAMHRPPNESRVYPLPLDQQWPAGIYSLSHIALPIPPDDPIYGEGTEDNPTLGRVELRGEQRLLRVPADQLMRLRYNPFHGYMQARILKFMKQAAISFKPPD